jgi:hypothetical protein
MKLELPEGAALRTIVLVTWDVQASAKAGAPNLEPGPQEGRIVRIDGSQVTVRFQWPNEPDLDTSDMMTTIDLGTGVDSFRGGIVKVIELRDHALSRGSQA